MEKILLAVGHRELEVYLESQLNKEFIFVGATVYREGILRAIGQKVPDIIVIRETLEGNENIMSIIYQIRTSYPNLRIIFLAGNRVVGDELLANLVNYGVYDILYGESIPANKIVSLIRVGNKYSDVKHLQPVPLLDEDRNKMLFEAPDVPNGVEVIEVIREIDTNNNNINQSNDISNEIVKNANKDTTNETFINRENKAHVSFNEVDSKNKDKKNIINKITNPINEKIQKNTSQKQSFTGTSIANEKIITFIGGKSGVGTTSLAINTAFLLAGMGKKVIYVELNEKFPAVSYWYELGKTTEGIDTCIEYLSKEEYTKIDNSIIKSKEIKEDNSLSMRKNYKKFPNTLDFLFYSKEYLSGIKNRMDIINTKELYLYLMYQMGYDFVIIDVASDINNEATQNGLIFSNKIFSVITQDVSSVGYYLFNLNNLENKGINISLKNNFIINRYVQSNFLEKDIKDWIEEKEVLIIPDNNRDFINANFKGLPVVLNSNNNNLKNSFNNIINNILKK